MILNNHQKVFFDHLAAKFIPFFKIDGTYEIQVVDGKVYRKNNDQSSHDTGVMFNDDILESFARACAHIVDKSLIRGTEIFDCSLKIEGIKYRLSVSLPPVTERIEIMMRISLQAIITLDDMLTSKVLDEKSIEIIRKIAMNKLLIVGAPASGKTTLLNAILHEIKNPNIRYVVIEEDAVEVNTYSANTTTFHNSPNTNIEEIVKKCFRSSPDRFVIGEIRSNNLAKAFYDASTSGTKTTISTIHANDAFAGFNRWANFLQNESIEKADAANNIDYLIYVSADDDDTVEKVSSVGRYVSEIAKVESQNNEVKLSYKYNQENERKG